MRESMLLKIAMVGVVVGLVVLYFLTQVIVVDEAHIEELGLENIDETVHLTGTVTAVQQRGSLTTATLLQQSEIDIVLFTDANVSFDDGDEIRILGTISEYQGEPQVLVDEVLYVR